MSMVLMVLVAWIMLSDGRGVGGRRVLGALLAEMTGHGVERARDIGLRGPAVQRVVVSGAEMAQHGVEVGVPAVHCPPPQDGPGGASLLLMPFFQHISAEVI